MKNFLEINRALAAKKSVFTQFFLHGSCAENALNPDGEPTVSRQSRLRNMVGKASVITTFWGAFLSNCLRSASALRPFRLRLDSLSLVSRQSDLAKYAAMVTLLLTLACGNVWGEDITITPTYNNRYATMPYGLVNVTGSVTPNSSAVYSAGSNGASFTITFATTKSDMYIKSVTFNSVSNGSLSSSDGTITSSVFTTSGSKNSVTITMASNSGKKGSLKITNIVVNTGSNSVETHTAFSVSSSTISSTAKINGSTVTPAVSMTTTGSASDNKLSIPNNGTITFTSSNNILYIAFFNPDNKILQSNQFQVNSTKLATGAWSGTSKSVTVTNKTGAARDISHIWVITESAACTAPNHVNITGTNKYLAGQDISLTATAYSSAGTGSPIAAGNITGYQWQKEINSVWTDVTNGTSDGVTVSGATTNNLRITPCNHYHSGQYRCVVSTGATCSTNSDAYGVHVFSIYGKYYSGEYSHNEITWTSGTTGTATIHLNASSTYLFKVWSNDGYYYGNGENNYIIQPVNWDCGTGNHEMRLFTGPEGDYTFTVNIEHGLDGSPYVNLQVAYPSVTHPVTGYVYLTKWWSCYPHFWDGSSNALSPNGYDPLIATYTTICGTDYWYMPALDNYTNVYFKDNATWGSATNHGDETSITGNSGKYYTHDGSSWDWHDFATYTISFNNGGGTGTMSSITGLCPDADQALPANTFTKDDYIFTGWHANVATKVGGATIAAGGNIADEATLQDINSNITLTAQWIACSGPTINSFVPSGKTDGTYPVGTALGTLTVTASAGNGGALSYLWYQYDGGNIGAAVAAAGTNNAATYSIPNNAACVDRHYYCVVSEAGCSTTRTSDISGALTLTAASLTALECNTLYEVPDMIPSGASLTSSDQFFDGLSANTKFELIGSASGSTTPKVNNNSSNDKTIDGITFDDGSMWFKGNASLTSNIPTTFGLSFIVPEGGGKLYLYFSGESTNIKLAKSGSSGSKPSCPNGYGEVDVTAGTYYLYGTGTSSPYSFYGLKLKCCTTPDAPTSPTNGATTSETQAVSWTDAGNDQWEVYVSTSSSTPGAGQTPTASPTSASYTFTGLTASTTYYWWVRSVCDASHKSSWVAGTSFTTSAAEVALVTWTMNLNTATWGAASTATTDGTNITSIATSRTDGGTGSSASATAKVSMASAEVTDTSEPSNSAKFTFTIASGKKVEPERVTCEVFNVSSGSRTYKAQISDSNGHVYNSTNTVAVSTEATLTPATFTFASDLVLTGNVTLKIYAWGSGSDFRMGESVKLFGEVDNYTCTALNLTRGGQENGTYTVGNYTGNPLTCTVNAGEPASYQWKQYTLGQGVGEAVNAVGSGSTTTSFTPNPASANTYFYACQVTDICGNSATTPYTGTFVFNAPVHHDVDFTLTNVTYSSGDNEGTDAATEGSAFSTVFAASSGYDLPSTITVTIGGSPATVSTDYTWNSSTGALEILAASVTGDIVVTIVGPEHVTSECITITDFETSNHSKSENKPDSEGKYFYGYKGTEDAAHAVTITATNGDCIGVNSGAELKVYAGKYVNIYADNTTTGGTPATFSNVTSVSIDAKMINSNYYTTFDIKVGETTIADDVSLVDAKSSYQTFTYDGLAQLSGKIKITNNGSGSSYNFYADNIQICTADMDACTTPVIPSLSDQALCEGANATAWDATVSNAATIEAAGESVAYKWQKKNGSNWDDISGATTATYDVDGSGTVTEAMAGTYRVLVTVSKAGYSSSSATREVTLSVTESTEVTGITANKATVYPGNSVTLTATANTTVTWQWYTCTNSAGDGEDDIDGATSASYAIASAPAAGTYYYKAKGTSSCGTAEYVYTLTVSAAAGGDCETYYFFANAADATTNGVTQNEESFFSGASEGTNNNSTSITVDGNNLSITKRTSASAYSVVFTIPTGATATLFINAKANNTSYPLTITRSSDSEVMEITNSTTLANYTLADIPEGTWTLSSGASKNWYYGAIIVKVCSGEACSDPEVTASADNSTICVGGSVTFTAANAHASATYQWQKYSGSAWTNISGATNATYTIASIAAEDETKYRVIATHDCSRTSNEVTLNVTAAPVFGDVPSSVSVMQTLALSISTVEATDAVKYKWYKSADATWDAGDAEIGTEKNLIKAYDGETAGSTYYIFCRAQNACGITTSSAIAINVTAYVEEDCATRGNEGEAEFGFDYGSAGQGSYSSAACWTMNSNSKFLTYTAPEGKYFKTAKVTIASSSESRASYNWSTDGGSTYTAVALTVNSTLTERTIDLSAKGNVNSFQIGRNFNSTGSSGGTLYVSKICFEYTEACTSTTVTPSTSSVAYEMGGAWSNPTFTLTAAAVAAGGTLTYSSSNEDIASVDDDGTVTFNGDAGVVRITASYAGDGTYCASEGYYTITVSCSAGTPSIAAGGSTNLSGCNASVTLTASGITSGGTYQWFRGGEEVDGATSASITVTQAGTYTVEYTKDGCTALSSNSIAVTSEATQPEVERLVPFQYYHVDKTYTDQMKMRHLFAVKNSGKLDGKSFKLYVSRNGGDPTDVTNSNALAIWTNADGRVDTVMIDLNKLSGKYSENDELVFTCKAIDCTPAVSETYKATITMHVIGATPTLALICSGSDKASGTRKTGELTVGGDFLTGYNKADLCEQTGNTSFDASTEWGLYTRLKANYIVTPVNGYANFYKLNYEPFDILLLTDYPKASKSDAAATVLDDMADLCDYRPLLSLKAHMVAKSPSKWAAKGFTTAPVVPKNTRTRLNIVCYAHPMFSTLKEKTDYVQEDYDDQSQIVYTMLKEGGYETKDGVKKGMQGFEIDAAENFVTIGLIHYNATAADDTPSDGYVTWTPGSGDRMLVAAAERQANPEARMILFAVNCGAQSKFTETGRTVIHKCLEYLLTDHTITPMADCSFTFDNGAGNPDNQATYKSKCPECTGTIGDGLWSTAGNWGPDYVLRPGKDTEVKIAAPVEVDMDHAVARSARIVEGGHITIPAGKALEIVGTIRRLDGSEISPTENSDIFIGSTSAGNGTLIFNNDKGDSKATVAMYTTAKTADPDPVTGKISAAASTWQYIGTPHNDVAVATYNYYDSWLYQYDTGTEGWTVIPNGGPLVPFRGYCVTHPEANHTFVMGGKLTATTSQEIAIPAGKFVVVANSWTAPIYVKNITAEDMENTREQTIYFFNTGSDSEQTGTVANGTYVAVPVHASSYTGDSLISSMQGFYVVGGGSDGTLHLDYERHVRPTNNRNIKSGPMHAPQHYAVDDEPIVAKLFFRGSRYSDRLVVLERADFSRGFDNGWDGEAWGGNDAAPYSCVSGENRWDAVSAIPDFEGTVVGFQAGEDNAYTIDFEYSEENAPLYLYDTEAKTYSRVLTGNAYYFTTSDKDYHDRFIFTRNAPSVITGIEPTSDSSVEGRAKKLLIEEKLFILLNGVLYDATGKVVK